MQISPDLKLGDHGVIRSPLRNGHEDGNSRNPHISEGFVTPNPTYRRAALISIPCPGHCVYHTAPRA